MGRRSIVLGALLAISGCDDPDNPGQDPDGPGPDAAVSAPDAGLTDAATPDAEPDALLPDAAIPQGVLNEIRCQAPEGVEISAELPGAALVGWSLEVDGAVIPLPDAALNDDGLAWIELGADAIGCGYSEVALLSPQGDRAEAVSVPLTPLAATWGRLPDAEGPWAITAPTPGAPNRPLAEAAAGWPDPDEVVEVRLGLASGSIQAMGYRGSLVVDGSLTVGERPSAPAKVRLSGWGGRYRSAAQRGRFRVDLDFDGGALDGVGGVYLDNLTLDRALVTPLLARRVMAAFGVPATRAGFAWLTVHDEALAPEARGLYLLTEAPRPSFTARVFPSTWHVFTGVGRELVAGDVRRFGAEVGSDGARDDLALIVEVIAAVAPEESFYEITAPFLNWPALVRAFAAEVYLGSVDGYGPRRRGSIFHTDQAGRLDLLLDGLDRTLTTAVPAHRGSGLLFSRCLADEACRGLYDAALADGVRALSGVDWAAEVEAALAPIEPWAQMDPSLATDWLGITAAAEARGRWLEARQVEMEALLSCLDAEVDEDGDGARCDLDCDPARADVYVGAPEICEDGVDQDCNGVPDDGADCGDCRAMRAGDRDYRICVGDYTWQAGRAQCQRLGLDLAVPLNEQQRDAVYLAIRAGVDESVWIGVSDEAEEGVYTTVSGASLVYAPWGEDQPDNHEEREHCVELQRGGVLNDLPCDATRVALCEAPCVDSPDGDGDGVTVCQGDCDDADGARAPGLAEICGDGVDQDCSGTADDALECGCVALTREGRRYSVCREQASFDAAAAQCAELGMSMATFEDAAEADWLWGEAVAIRRQGYWVGFSDREQEMAFVDADGSRPRYAPWHLGEPNDYGDGEDCAHFWPWGPVWNDAGCGAEYGVLCKE